MNNPTDTPDGENKIVAFFDHSSFFTVLLALLLLAASMFVIVAPNPAVSVELLEGQQAPYTLYTDFKFTTEDWKVNEKNAEEAADKEPDYYKISEAETERVLKDLSNFTGQLKRREELEKIHQTYKAAEQDRLQEQVQKLSPATLKFLQDVLSSPSRKKELDEMIRIALREGILTREEWSKIGDGRQIKVIDPQNRRQKVGKNELITTDKAGARIAKTLLSGYESAEKDQIEKQAAECLTAILSPGNLFFDKEFTEGRKMQVRLETAKLMKTFKKGVAIIQKGKKLTREDALNLKAYREAEKKQSDPKEIYKMVGKNILLCLALLVVLGLYLFHMQPMFRRSNRLLWQLGLVIIAGILLDRLSSNCFLVLTEQYSIPRQELVYFVVPAGFSAVVISVVFGARTAFFAGLFVSAVAALPQENQFLMFFGGLLVNAVGALAVRNVKNYRSYFSRIFVSISLTTLLVSVIFQLRYLQDSTFSDWQRTCYLLLCPFATGLLTALLAQLGLYLLEMIFDVNTPMALQSFYDFNHPLLKELQMKASGTYHHCLMVSMLAEKAAEEAGLDPIKARVCGMFHDVGKLVQPDYFVENSKGRDMHKNLDPKMSAMIIRSHVALHGPDQARKYKLKRLLLDTITQHHGDDLIVFFYQKEKDLHPGETVSENDFRYPGPRPSDPEISLVMLADCCEAASRTLDKPTSELLAQLVSDIFRKKIRNGQLDASNLTMHQLAIIRDSFVNSLKTMFHGRIAYPKEEKKDENDLFMAAGKDLPPS